MCQKRHEIFIINLQNGDVIKNELLLVKGIVQQKCDISVLTFSEAKISKQFEVSSTGEFRALWLLEEGLHKFQINYCRATYEIEIKYCKSNSDYKVQPLYLICKDHNGRFVSPYGNNTADDACEIISLGLKLVQCLYSEKIQECGLDRKTFTIQSDCIPFYTNLDVETARNLDENSLWNKFAYEIINSELGLNEKIKFVAFVSCTLYEGINNEDYSYANIKKHTKAHAALGGGGLALFGSACLYTWPRSIDEIIPYFVNNTPIDLSKFWDESNYRRTLGGCFATTLGAVCHEIGHTFDLGHTKDGIMGNGFDYVNRVFTINNLTEVLPDRLVENNLRIVEKDKRLTRFKKPDTFLTKYHEQKSCDGTFFARNCALILYYHKWLNNYQSQSSDDVYLDKSTHVITSNSALKVIEVREKTNGLVVDYIDLFSEHTIKAKLKESTDYQMYDVFVITENGTTKLFT